MFSSNISVLNVLRIQARTNSRHLRFPSALFDVVKWKDWSAAQLSACCPAGCRRAPGSGSRPGPWGRGSSGSPAREHERRSDTDGKDRDVFRAFCYLDLVQHGRIRTPVLAEVDEVRSCPVVVDQQHLWREAPQQSATVSATVLLHG